MILKWELRHVFKTPQDNFFSLGKIQARYLFPQLGERADKAEELHGLFIRAGESNCTGLIWKLLPDIVLKEQGKYPLSFGFRPLFPLPLGRAALVNSGDCGARPKSRILMLLALGNVRSTHFLATVTLNCARWCWNANYTRFFFMPGA